MCNYTINQWTHRSCLPHETRRIFNHNIPITLKHTRTLSGRFKHSIPLKAESIHPPVTDNLLAQQEQATRFKSPKIHPPTTRPRRRHGSTHILYCGTRALRNIPDFWSKSVFVQQKIWQTGKVHTAGKNVKRRPFHFCTHFNRNVSNYVFKTRTSTKDRETIRFRKYPYHRVLRIIKSKTFGRNRINDFEPFGKGYCKSFIHFFHPIHIFSDHSAELLDVHPFVTDEFLQRYDMRNLFWMLVGIKNVCGVDR